MVNPMFIAPRGGGTKPKKSEPKEIKNMPQTHLASAADKGETVPEQRRAAHTENEYPEVSYAHIRSLERALAVQGDLLREALQVSMNTHQSAEKALLENQSAIIDRMGELTQKRSAAEEAFFKNVETLAAAAKAEATKEEKKAAEKARKELFPEAARTNKQIAKDLAISVAGDAAFAAAVYTGYRGAKALIQAIWPGVPSV